LARESKGQRLEGAYPFDVELAKVGVAGCLNIGSVMLGRCLSIMQHCRVAAESQSDLQRKNANLEKQVKQLLKEKADKDELERQVQQLKKGQC